MRKIIYPYLLLTLLFLLSACSPEDQPQETKLPDAEPPTQQASATMEPTFTLTPTITLTPTPTQTPTITPTPLPTDSPEQPLPVEEISAELGVMDQIYLRLQPESGSNSLPVFKTGEDVVDYNIDHTLDPDTVYINCDDKYTASNGVELCLMPGHGRVEAYRFSPTTPDDFLGVRILQQPATDFGWVVQRELTPYIRPSFYEPLSNTTFLRYDRVRIYEEQLVGKTTWYRIGEDLWVPATTLSVVRVDRVKPAAISSSRWIAVDIWEQVVMVYENNALIYATLTSTGDDYKLTDTGLYQIYLTFETTTMSGGADEDYYYLERVPWTMYFDGGNALHGAYWHSSFGYPRTHGCVKLAPADAHWLFNWAIMGDAVYVFDSREE